MKSLPYWSNNLIKHVGIGITQNEKSKSGAEGAP